MRIPVLAVILITFLCTFINADAKTEIAALLKQQDAAWNRGDLDGFVAPYDSTNELVFIGSTGAIRSREALKEKYEKKYKIGGADFGKLTFSDLQVEELSKGFARAWGKWEVDQHGTKASGWFTLILRKSKGAWHIIHDHSS